MPTPKLNKKDERIIPLKSVHNLRTLAGLKGRGGVIRENILLRSAALDKITEKDARILKEKYALKTVIDLRTNDEVKKSPDRPIEGVTYLHLPVCREAIPGVSREVEPGKECAEEMLPDAVELYRNLPADAEVIANLSVILKTILAHRDGAVLWHCTAGKDRCGLTAAFILMLLGVEPDTVLYDYLLTNLDARPTALKYYLFLRFVRRNKRFAEKVYSIYSAEEAFLNAALDTIRTVYGGVDAYLRNQIKLTEAEISAFREYALLKA